MPWRPHPPPPPQSKAAAAHAVGELKSAVSKALRYASGPRDIEFGGFQRALRDALVTASGRDSTSVFGEAAALLLRSMSHITWIDDAARVEYLFPLVRSAAKVPLWIASLNYDNAIELAAAQVPIEVDVGLKNRTSDIAFEPTSSLCGAKLHGSINWKMQPDSTVTLEERPTGNAALIFDSGNKLRFEGPFLDLLFAFREQLRHVDTLEVCGYSFRDAHVNHIVLSWLRAKGGREVYVNGPSASLRAVTSAINAQFPPGQSIHLE